AQAPLLLFALLMGLAGARGLFPRDLELPFHGRDARAPALLPARGLLLLELLPLLELVRLQLDERGVVVDWLLLGRQLGRLAIADENGHPGQPCPSDGSD